MMYLQKRKYPTMSRLTRTAKLTGLFLVYGIGTNYLALCFANASISAIELHPWYGLLIFRLFVIFFYALINIFTMPFKEGFEVIAAIVQSFVIFPLIGLLYSLMTWKTSNNANKNNPTICLFFVLGVILGFYWFAVNVEAFTGNPIQYTRSSTVPLVILSVTVVCWFYNTIKYTIKG